MRRKNRTTKQPISGSWGQMSWIWLCWFGCLLHWSTTSNLALAISAPSINDSSMASSLSNNRPTLLQDKDESAKPVAPDQKTAARPGALIRVPLPITVAAAAQIKGDLKKLAENAPVVVQPSSRMLVVLEFDTQDGKTGRGSELEACQLLARFLVSQELNKIETVAYIPAPRGLEEKEVLLSGHAILVAIAANQIAMDEGTSIGSAGIDESTLEPLVQDVYRGIASQRLRIPVPMVLAMLDKDRQLYRVQTDKGMMFVDGDELAELEKKNEASDSTTLSESGSFANFSAADLVEFGFVRHQVKNRAELNAALNLASHSLDQSRSSSEKWRAVQINFPGNIEERTSTWIMRSLGNQLGNSKPPNLIILNLDEKEGDINACLKLARYLTDLDSEKIQTVAHIRGNISGSAAMLALACDQVLMASDARLGGKLSESDRSELTPSDIEDALSTVKSLARDQQKDWSLLLGMLKPDLVVERCQHKKTGQLRLLSEDELRALDDAADWAKLGPIDTENGLTATVAEQLLVARAIANDESEVKAFYQLEEDPIVLETTAFDRRLERFAGFLSRPDVASLLLFMAVFLLSSEMSTPGLGVAGFFSALFFTLFFWSQYFEGNAGWLEILLFLVGATCILIELFITPGFGVFGIGGIAMVISSLILASQNFKFNISDLEKLPSSMLPVLGAALGFFVALFVLRNLIPHSPVLKRLILAPREVVDTGLHEARDPEAMVDWSHLMGKRGETVTRLSPSGKARINGKVYDVISSGQMVDSRKSVQVIEAIGNRVVVEPNES